MEGKGIRERGNWNKSGSFRDYHVKSKTIFFSKRGFKSLWEKEIEDGQEENK